jgi:hypothetical protein
VVTASVSAKQNVVQTFQDKSGIFHDISSITSMSRSADLTSVSMDVEGKVVRVEINPTEAINIIEMFG